MINKITAGYVVQKYDEEKEEFISQEFQAGDMVDWEDEEGITLDPERDLYLSDSDDAYLPFEMKQPLEIKEDFLDRISSVWVGFKSGTRRFIERAERIDPDWIRLYQQEGCLDVRPVDIEYIEYR